MKIFQICSKSPFPPKEGGPIAMNNITQGLLKAGHSVKVLAINTPKYFVEATHLPKEYLNNTGFETVFINTNIKVSKAFWNLFSNKSYNIERFISQDFEEKIKQIISENDFDIVQLESMYVAPYIETIRKYSKTKIILRAHNIEHVIWQRLIDSCSSPVKKLYLKHLTKTLKKFELGVLNKVDGIAAITPCDAKYFVQAGCVKPVISIPIGIDNNKIPAANQEREFPGLFHLGSMNWMPNEEGIYWFLEMVWPGLIQELPEVHLHLAGRKMPQWLQQINMPGVNVQGEVKNAFEFMHSKTVMIVPLLAGSGMRVKIIEGMACGNTIISTSTGAEGISYTDGVNILIADTPDEFIQQIKKCIDNPSKCVEIGKQAQKLVAEEYDNDVITGRLVEFYEGMKK